MRLWSFSRVGLSLELDFLVVCFLVKREVWIMLSSVMRVGPSALGSTFLAPPGFLKQAVNEVTNDKRRLTIAQNDH